MLAEVFSVAFGRRSYNPTLGRWINRDPIGEMGGNNLFSLVNNQPLKYVDPVGNAGMSPGAEGLLDILFDIWIAPKIQRKVEDKIYPVTVIGPDSCGEGLDRILIFSLNFRYEREYYEFRPGSNLNDMPALPTTEKYLMLDYRLEVYDCCCKCLPISQFHYEQVKGEWEQILDSFLIKKKARDIFTTSWSEVIFAPN
ncbi:MAG: RHS repeat-associated core domain-containing protein [Lentisphaeria bacterium]|nr:RHS repeat-associated core domain-containing protein [Lentisphaeria bacterium]